MKRSKRVLSIVLATAIIVTSIPAMAFFKGLTNVEAEVSFKKKGLGVAVMCNDLQTDKYEENMYNALVNTPSAAEDSKNGSVFNNVKITDLKYSDKHGSNGKTYDISLTSDQFKPLAEMAKKNQIQQSITAYAKNHNHRSTKRHWNKIKQYCKIILGYPTSSTNESFYLGKCYETNNNNDYSQVGGYSEWTKLNGSKSRLAIYLTAKKGCDGCSGAYIEKVGLAFKDTTAPKITIIQMYKKTKDGRVSAEYLKANDVLQFEVKFSEYVRLADNNGASAKSTAAKLAFDLGKLSTKKITTEKASLVSIDGDTAIFEYTVKDKVDVDGVKNPTDYYVSQISALEDQTDLVSSSKSFPRVLVDANGNTISTNSSTFNKIRSVLSAAKKDLSVITYTTSVITDIAGNPLDSNSLNVGISNVVLDTVSPKINNIYITCNQKNSGDNDDEKHYLKNGATLDLKVIFNERLKEVSTNDYEKIVASLNIKKSNGDYLQTKVKNITYGSNTELYFERVTIDSGMYVEVDNGLTYKQKSDYKVTVKSLSFNSLLMDRSLNVASIDKDLREPTKNEFYTDNEAPKIKIVDTSNNKQSEIDENKNYSLTRFGNKGEVYQIVLCAEDFDSRLNKKDSAFVSGVNGGRATLSVDLLTDEALKIKYALSNKALSFSDLNSKCVEMNSKDNLYITTGTQLSNIDLVGNSAYLYLYLKFDESKSYAAMKSGIKVNMSATDINGNTKNTSIKFNYTAADRVKPELLGSSIKLINNNDNSASQTASIDFSDLGGIDVNSVKYVWVEENQSVPDESKYSVLSSENITNIKKTDGKVTSCTANISTKKIGMNQTYKASLYVIVKDVSGNSLELDKIETAYIDTNLPVMQLQVTEEKGADEYSVIMNGPFTSSTNEIKYFVAIEDPKNKGFYFVRRQQGVSDSIALKDYNILNDTLLSFSDDYDREELGKWSYCKITKENAKYTLTVQADLNTNVIYRKRLLAIGSNYHYGYLNIMAGTGFTTAAFESSGSNTEYFYADKGQFIEKTMLMLPDQYALSTTRDVKNEGYNTYSRYSHIAHFKPDKDYGRWFDRSSVVDYNPEKYGPEYPTTLADAQFEIEITNSRTDEFITDDINFDSENTCVRLKSVETGKYVYQWKLTEGIAKQLITIPKDLKLDNGQYVLEVSLANYLKDPESNVLIYTYENIYIYNYDNEMTEAFGIDTVTTNVSFTAPEEYTDAHIPPYYNFKNIGDYGFNRTFTDKFNPNYTSSSADAYKTDTIYLGNCLTDTDSDGNTINYNKTVKFSFNGLESKDIGDCWIKIWAGDTSNSELAKWYTLKDFTETTNTMYLNGRFVDGKAECSVENAKAFYELNRHSDMYEIPVFEGSNTISYQIINKGGVKSSVHEIEVYYCKDAPGLKIDVEESEGISTGVNARVSELSSNLVTKDINLYESKFDGKEEKITPITDREFTYKRNKRYLYYAVDGYGNLSFVQFHITNVDVSSPLAYFETISPAKYESFGDEAGDGRLENAYLDAIIIDDKSLIDADIQITVDDNEPYVVKADELFEHGDGYANGYVYEESLADTGMSDVQLFYGPNLVVEGSSSYYDGNHSLKIYMVLNDDIDPTKGDKEKVRHNVVITVMDTVGKTLEKPLTATGGDIYGLNNVPKITSTYCEPEAEYIELNFSGRVRVTKINGEDVPEELYKYMKYTERFTLTTGEMMGGHFEGDMALDLKLKDYFGISKDGTYEIEYLDTFNNTYTSKFTVADFFGNYSADIEYSTSALTNQNVVATITGTDKNAELTLADPEATSDNYTISWNKSKSKATIEFNQNDTVRFNLKVKGAVEDKVVSYNVTVGNIDKKAPDDVEVMWVFNENGLILNGKEIDMDQLNFDTTNNSIDVYISSPSEDICGINGKDVKHRFTYAQNMERSYTFEYADECGNVGEPIVVTLPEELVMKEYEAPIPAEGEEVIDTEAPEVSAEIYGVYDGVAEYKTSWSPDVDTFEEMVEDIGYTGGYKIKYNLLDQSKSKIVVINGLDASTKDISYSSSSAQIDGVRVSENDNTIIITKPCEVTVVAVDAEGNKVVHGFAVSKIDTEKPAVTVKKVGKSFTLMRLQFYTDDNTDAKNALGTIIPVTQGLKMGMDDDGYYYYMEVSNNGTYNTTFRDKSGNRTTLSTSVTEIDNMAPSIKVSTWSPCYTNNGKPVETIAPNSPTNSSVIVSLDFDKTVSELKVYYKDNENWIEDTNIFSATTIELGGRKGKVEFKDSVPSIVKIVATSPNGMSNEISDIDLVGIIDKKAPTIKSTKVLENNTVKVSFVADEKVFVTGCDYDTTYGGNTNIPLTIKKNGTYNVSFADMAGNVVSETITVDNIDEIAPELFALGIPESYVTAENCIIKVTMSEKGKITFQGNEYKVKAPVDKNGDGKLVGDELDWITLPIKSNGNFQVKATDDAGLISYKLLEVKYVDDVAPYIQFNKPVLSVSQGTSLDELKNLLLDESTYNLWDDIDEAPQITLENLPDDKTLNNQGVYEVHYILKDYAGNERLVYRYVKVISSANLIVKANGEYMTACDTTILSENNVTITLDKSKRKGESFKIYYKHGIRKAGSMKNASVSKNGNLRDLDSGFYTLYIVTQNKESYLTYIYIRK